MSGQAHVVLTVAGSRYALPLGAVVNIAPFQQPTRIPGAPVAVRGVIDFEQRPVMLIDLGTLLTGRVEDRSNRTCILFLRTTSTDTVFGAIADAVDGVIDGGAEIGTDRSSASTDIALLGADELYGRAVKASSSETRQ